ncbi:LysR family transcriptional regulator [Pseudomonas asiatica]|uniref:LysR family transcriptional regulator n=1 Tax=Pseudomonas asiatica TaxID=2219225 RepID=A0A9X4DEM7_9PSED|nr:MULTISPECIES: LysR family transcriptional regulator [Pseudomonas]MEE1902651.1 LysR family transcriptional regulator [Pseudomonas inefficax]AHD15914.1 LysR family transcriptional regulator [Pseudomonas sp. FGI182]MDD2114780.1 LysR family transcriptional regulator [Pseudomonas asiatica]MEE1907444.1 LysR family transcriptional regulator [Pseudomonas inefficax]MEE1984908.1 LysR family transcriptional regulator [Pseudomonas inefficax]
MNMRFLETFVWVARLKSFRLTAEKLFSTQASISSRIAALEDELGARLFLRDSKGVTLTPEGQRVLEYAEHMMDTLQALKRSISNAGNVKGLVRLGAMDSVIHTWLSLLVTQLMERYPGVEIELTADTARNLNEQLHKGYLDLVFQTDVVRGDTLRNQALAHYPVEWIVSTNSLYHRTYNSLEELTRERVVTFSKNSRPHQDILNLLHTSNIANPRINCVNSVAAMTRLIRDGFGIGALPASLVAEELEQGRMTVLENVPKPAAMEIIATWRSGVGLGLVEQVVRLAQEVVQQYAEQMGPHRVTLAHTGEVANL